MAAAGTAAADAAAARLRRARDKVHIISAALTIRQPIPTFDEAVGPRDYRRWRTELKTVAEACGADFLMALLTDRVINSYSSEPLPLSRDLSREQPTPVALRRRALEKAKEGLNVTTPHHHRPLTQPDTA